jgi:hypothetical protein
MRGTPLHPREKPIAMTTKRLYKVIFVNQGKVYEIYARGVGQSTLYGFVEVESLSFGERSAVVIDPSEDRLKTEFQDVKRTYIPIHAVIRIDEVEKQGVAKIIPLDSRATRSPGTPGTFYGSADRPKGDS